MSLTDGIGFESQKSLLSANSFSTAAHLTPGTMYSCEFLLPLIESADCGET